MTYNVSTGICFGHVQIILNDQLQTSASPIENNQLFFRPRLWCNHIVDCNVDLHPNLAFYLRHLDDLISWIFLKMIKYDYDDVDEMKYNDISRTKNGNEDEDDDDMYRYGK